MEGCKESGVVVVKTAEEVVYKEGLSNLDACVKSFKFRFRLAQALSEI